MPGGSFYLKRDALTGPHRDVRGELRSQPRCARCRPLIYEPLSLPIRKRAKAGPGCYLQRGELGTVQWLRPSGCPSCILWYFQGVQNLKQSSHPPTRRARYLQSCNGPSSTALRARAVSGGSCYLKQGALGTGQGHQPPSRAPPATRDYLVKGRSGCG